MTTERLKEIERERSNELAEKLWFFDDPEVVKNFIQSDSERIRELVAALRFPLPFREASEKPEELESIFVVSRVTDWDSDNMRFIPTPDCVFRFDESPYPGSRDAFTEFDLGWIYEVDILRIFRAWKEGKAA